mmetsp:Transcript_11590/g.31776  ORF Transcript_11590/g.31776 Transcript_11590/m.31776 type:complete len:215 (+) Transcript_11590:192-836(+)
MLSCSRPARADSAPDTAEAKSFGGGSAAVCATTNSSNSSLGRAHSQDHSCCSRHHLIKRIVAFTPSGCLSTKRAFCATKAAPPYARISSVCPCKAAKASEYEAYSGAKKIRTSPSRLSVARVTTPLEAEAPKIPGRSPSCSASVDATHGARLASQLSWRACGKPSKNITNSAPAAPGMETPFATAPPGTTRRTFKKVLSEMHCAIASRALATWS